MDLLARPVPENTPMEQLLVSRSTHLCVNPVVCFITRGRKDQRGRGVAKENQSLYEKNVEGDDWERTTHLQVMDEQNRT